MTNNPVQDAEPAMAEQGAHISRPGPTQAIAPMGNNRIGMVDPIEHARIRGENSVKRIADLVGANEPERQSMAEIERRIRHGYKFIDVIIRKDGVETRHQLDWLARLFRIGEQP